MKKRKKQKKPNPADGIRGRLSRVLTRRNQAILYVMTIMLAVLSAYNVVTECFIVPVSIALYICTGICFFSSCALWIQMILSLIREILFPYVERNRILRLFIHDYRLRTALMALPGLGINIIFAVFNAALGVIYQSPWNGTLAAYYILLCIMRFISVLYAKSIYINKREQTERELKVYRNCGRLLSAMSVALAGAVILLFTGNGGATYAGHAIYGVAAYTFYKVVMSVLNMLRARKEKSLLAITLRNIGHCDALVSLLSMQTALLASFGRGSAEFAPIMNAATGLTVSIAALSIGLHMSYDGKQKT